MYSNDFIRLILLALALTVCACGKVSTNADADDATDIDAGSEAQLSVVVDRMRIRQDGLAMIAIEVTRTNYQGALAVEVTGLPTGVTASPLTLAAGATTGMLSLAATGATVTATPVETTVTATAVDDSGLVATTTSSLYVAGLPGSFDTSFSFDGVVLYTVTDREYDATRGMSIDSQGRISVGGVGQGADPWQGWVARFLPDGAIDSSFGSGGVYTGFEVGSDTASSVSDIIQVSDDSLLVLASSSTPSNVQYLRALAASGAIDSSFGGGGDAVITEPIRRVRARSSGYLVSGYDDIVALSSTGVVDPSFSLATGLPSNIGDMAVDVSDRIILGGYDPAGFTISRLLPDGALDTSFGTGGSTTVAHPVGTDDPVIRHIKLFPDNGGVAMGVSNFGDYAQNTTVLLRFGADGLPDNGFGTAGLAPFLGNGVAGFVSGLVLQEDGMIVGSGSIRIDTNSFEQVLKRFNSDGSVDTSFGAAGTVALEESARAVILDAAAGRALILANDSGGGIHLTRIWL